MQGIRYHSKGVFIDRRYNDEIYGRHACEHGSLVFRFLKEGAPRRRKLGGFCLDTSGVPAGRRGYRRPASFRRAARRSPPPAVASAPTCSRAPRSCRPKQWRCRRDQSAPARTWAHRALPGELRGLPPLRPPLVPPRLCVRSVFSRSRSFILVSVELLSSFAL